ncbi:hypothetical protein FCL40_17760 [Ferrimonas sediminicola]|uniref:DnaT DNA-binding domain-containing protein n=1 Tax=Ferrimonas sediminicola TaxID=2569538 RepID=A0A4U1B7P8_9GAMM|nr:DnaT-like ssDNA-binding domain-containing protein [Ferrimonas sediminicola]TKB46496.1 hypothetical protein FCL40_17760 [Ferrimonas sediminicola]
MNRLEYQMFDESPGLSNLARMVYAFGLRRMSNYGSIKALNLSTLAQLVSRAKDGETKEPPIERLISALKELIEAKIIQASSTDGHWEGCYVALPYQMEFDPYQHGFQMHADWTPGAELVGYLRMLGIGNHDEITLDELYDFTVYWMGRHDSFHTQDQWTSKLARSIAMQRRKGRGLQPSRVPAEPKPQASTAAMVDRTPEQTQSNAQRMSGLEKLQGKKNGEN